MIQLDDSPATRVLAAQARELDPKALNRAITRALNRAGRGARTEMSREVRKTVRLRSSDVSATVTLGRARAGESVPTFTMTVKQAPVPLVRFGTPRQGRKGVSVTIVKGKRQTLAGAFIVDSLGGHAFLRRGKSSLPIRKLFGPSVRQLAPKALEEARPRIVERLTRELERQIERELAKLTKE